MDIGEGEYTGGKSMKNMPMDNIDNFDVLVAL